jgi:hypothetical protein
VGEEDGCFFQVEDGREDCSVVGTGESTFFYVYRSSEREFCPLTEDEKRKPQ